MTPQHKAGEGLDLEDKGLVQTVGSAGIESGRAAGTPSLERLSTFQVRTPTPDELYASCRPWYERNSFTFIDQWPQRLLDLSFPTKLIPVDIADLRALWDHDPEPAMTKLAAMLDEHMGWQNWFVRLNTRSPKDASYPEPPITCAGKQAVMWITCSERCLDDTSALSGARAPAYICLREAAFLHPDGEFRCFAKDGKLLGVSRYFYERDADCDQEADQILTAANAFFQAHLMPDFPTVVFDLYAPGTPNEKLIEINPYGLSDPCLFGSYAEIEGVGGFRTKRPDDGAERVHSEADNDEPGLNPKSSLSNGGNGK